MSYRLTVGLEVHAELRTETKMFCRSKNDPDEERPNQNICPVCMAHPGSLPVINREAVKHVLRMGLAVDGQLADYTEFDRKNYFYPDLPKGYQISQYEYPLVSGGSLNGVEITRIHLEEDTARSGHDAASGATFIDYNRAGVPLMELVTEPVMHTPQEVGDFARELRLLLRSLGASSANMEKGEMRVEANISVSKDAVLGSKVEVKNLNSIKAAERAIAYEYERQSKILEEGGSIEQETRGWDETAQQTFSQRVKEGSADYRYFPDPDLPSLTLSEIPEFSLDALRSQMPLLPWDMRAQYRELGLSADDADLYVRDREYGAFFDAVAKDLSGTGDQMLLATASNYIASDLAKYIRDADERDTEAVQKIPGFAARFSSLVRMIGRGDISSRGAKDLLQIIISEQGEPYDLAKEHGLLQASDAASLMPAIEKVLGENQDAIAEYRAGKESVLQFLIGQAMKATRGSGNPAALKELIMKALTDAE